MRGIREVWMPYKKMKKTFICQLCSIQATKRQPFLNVDTHEDLTRSHAEKFLMIADVGGQDFSMTEKQLSMNGGVEGGEQTPFDSPQSSKSALWATSLAVS